MLVPVAMAVTPELAGGGWLGQYAPQESGGSETGFSWGARGRVRWTELWGVELAVGTNPAGPTGNLSLVRFLGEPSQDLVPHVAVGAGIASDRSGFATFGGGFDIVLLSWLDLRLDGRVELGTDGRSALLFGVAPIIHTRRVYDGDVDGVPDRMDACLRAAEDVDGHLDQDGCPDLDDDGDGLLDVEDRCVNLPEDVDGTLDKDGCPDPDDDDDGVVDGADRCRDTPEDLDDYEDLDGCPDSDNDRDFVRDETDLCPDVMEDGDGFEDDDGCPDPDNDADGAADKWDDAPLEPETFNGWRDEDGAPDVVPPVLARLLGPLEVGIARTGGIEGSTIPLLASILASFPEARIDLVGLEEVGLLTREALWAAGAGPDQIRVISGEAGLTVRLSTP